MSKDSTGGRVRLYRLGLIASSFFLAYIYIYSPLARTPTRVQSAWVFVVFDFYFSNENMDLNTQHISHGLGGFFLRRGGDMGIGVQGEACGEVTEHTADCLDVHTVLESDGCEGVAEVMESDLGDSRAFQYSF